MLQILKRPGVRPLTAAIFAVGALTGASQVWANTAATATVRNVVTVAYNNAAGTAQPGLTAAVDVTVNLVRGTAALSAPVDQTVAGTVATYTYTVTNTSNGINTYNLSTGVTESAISGSTASPSVASVTLGATTVTTGTTIAASGTTVITVPRDGTADTSVNGIAVGDTIVIGGAVYTVSAISDQQVPASPSTAVTTTISVTGNGTAQVVTAGTLIAERQTVTVAVTPGSLTTGADGTVTVVLTATDGITTAATDTTVTTVTSIGLSVSKLVRNVTNAVVGSGAVTYAGNTYYAGGVTGNPSEVLEYLVVVTKGSSASSATGVKVNDPIPPFTTYVAASMGIDNTSSGTFSALTDGDDADAGETDASTVYFFPGTGGTGTPAGVGNGTGGTLVTNAISRMKFRVTIQ